MSSKPTFRPLDNGYRMKPKGQFLLRLKAEIVAGGAAVVFEKGGDYDEFKWSNEIEESEVYSNEFPEKTLALNDITKAEPQISFTARMHTEILRQIGFLAESGKTIEQLAAADQEVDVDVAVNQVVRLPHRAVKNVVVKSGATALVLGSHYDVDAEGGFVDVFAFPDAVVPDADGKAPINVAYDADAVVGRKAWGLMSNTQIRVEIVFIQKMKWGRQHEVIFHDVQLRPDGDVVVGADGDDFATMTFTGRVYADTSQPAGFQLGTVVDRLTR